MAILPLWLWDLVVVYSEIVRKLWTSKTSGVSVDDIARRYRSLREPLVSKSCTGLMLASLAFEPTCLRPRWLVTFNKDLLI